MPSRHKFGIALGSELSSRDVMQSLIIERAYQLASSGDYRSLELIERALSEEGYENAFLHFRGRTLRSDLTIRMREAAERLGTSAS